MGVNLQLADASLGGFNAAGHGQVTVALFFHFPACDLCICSAVTSSEKRL